MTDNEIVGEQVNNLTFAVSGQLVETIQDPTFIYETTYKLASKFEAEKQQYIITQSQKLGINPNIVIEQQQFIGKLKVELAEVRSASEKRKSALQDVLAIPEKKAQSPYVLTQREWGYNQALSEMHQAITNRLGGME